MRTLSSGPYRVTIESLDGKEWRLQGNAFSMEMEQHVEHEAVYSDYDLMGRTMVTNQYLTLTAHMNSATMSVMSRDDEAVGNDAISRLAGILGG